MEKEFEFDWIVPSTNHVRIQGKDVIISVVGKKHPTATIKFYKGCENQIVKNGGKRGG